MGAVARENGFSSVYSRMASVYGRMRTVSAVLGQASAECSSHKGSISGRQPEEMIIPLFSSRRRIGHCMTKGFNKTLLGLILAAYLLLGQVQPLYADAPFQEGQCSRWGWQAVVLDVGGLPRRILWKGPDGPWVKGAIVVLHGGGGRHFQFCVANARVVGPQVRFTEMALQDGFAVFLLESSDRVTDNEGRPCGKVWDDEVRNRANLDLPFIESVIRTV